MSIDRELQIQGHMEYYTLMKVTVQFGNIKSCQSYFDN